MVLLSQHIYFTKQKTHLTSLGRLDDLHHGCIALKRGIKRKVTDTVTASQKL
jgi:hypothetical protein